MNIIETFPKTEQNPNKVRSWFKESIMQVKTFGNDKIAKRNKVFDELLIKRIPHKAVII